MIGQETLDRVRQLTGIAELIGDTVKLTKRGRSHLGLCPFHKEKTPSFHVNEERGFYHCFGCGESGDAIKFVQQTEGLTFIEAVRRLAERAGIEIVETASELERKQQAELRRRQQELYDAGNIAALFYERMLREHPLRPLALAELERRGLPANGGTGQIADALQAFRIGYAPYGWDALAKHLRESGVSAQAAEKVGLLAPRKTGPGHYDRFRHRLMFAVLDLQGRVIAFSGRALEEPTSERLREASLEPLGNAASSGDAPAKYVNSPESPIYRKREAVFGLYQARQALRASDRAILVEGNFDVVSLHARGIQSAIAPLGTAFTEEQAKQIKRFAPRLTLLFDGDAAGRKAVHTAREACRGAGLEVHVGSLPEGSDPDDLVRRHGPEAIERVVKAARSLLEYLIEVSLDSSFSADDARAKAARIRQVAELLAQEEDPAVRLMAKRHADRIASSLGIADATTFEALDRAVRNAFATPVAGAETPARRPDPPARARSRDRRDDIGREILGALLDYPTLFDTPEVLEGLELLEGELAAGIAALRQSCDDLSIGNPEEVLAKLSPSIHPFALARLAAPRHEVLEDARTELVGNVKKLKGLELQRQNRSEVVEELQRAAAMGDFEKEDALLREQIRRARERRGL